MDDPNKEGSPDHPDPGPPLTPELSDSDHHHDKNRPKKRVVINEEVQVFTIMPHSTKLKLEPSPAKVPALPGPEGPHLSATNVDIIITDTIYMLNIYLHRCLEMRITAQKRVFILYRICEDVERYSDHLRKLKNFFCHNEQIQSKWYSEFCSMLPSYGDYLKCLNDSDDVISLRGVPHLVPQACTKKLVEDVVEAVFAGGNFVKSQLTLGKVVDRDERQRLFDEYLDPLLHRSTLLRRIDEAQKTIRRLLLSLNAQVNFLQADLLGPIPDLDLSKVFK